jgi:chaperonin GroES
MESTQESTNGITGIEKVQPRGVVQADLQESLARTMPQARTVLRDVRGFVPLRDQVMVRRLAEDDMTLRDTLHIPDEAKEKPHSGLVLAVGGGKFDIAGGFHPCECSVNDVVLFGRYAGTEYLINGETVLVMNESQIVGILR